MKRISRYVALGLTLYGATLVLMYAFVEFGGIPELLSYALVQIAFFAMGLHFARTWVFEVTHTSASLVATKFLLSTAVFRALNWAVFAAFLQFGSIERELAIVLAISTVLPLKYWTERQIVFT